MSSAPDDATALTLQGRIRIAEGNCAEAQPILNKAVRSDPQSAAAYYYLGAAQKACGLLDLAKASLMHSLERNPRLAGAAAALAGLSAKAGDLAEAQSLTDRALLLDPNQPSANLTRARLMLAGRQSEQGKALLQKILRQNPASVSALAMLLSQSIKEKKTSEIVPLIRESVWQYPKNAALRVLLGVAYFDLKDLERSEASAVQALALDPKVPDAYTLLANIDFAKGAAGSARTHLLAAIGANPGNVANYMALVTQYEKEKNWDEAKKICEKAHQVAPAASNVAAELAFLYLEHGGDVNMALSLAQLVKQKLPDSPISADVLGWSYYKLGSFDSAIEQLTESTRMAPNNALYQYHLGMAYMAARHYALAGRTLRMALQADGNSLEAASTRAALSNLTKKPD